MRPIKILAVLLITFVLVVAVLLIILIIGQITIGFDSILRHIGAGAVGLLCGKCACVIVNKVGKENERD